MNPETLGSIGSTFQTNGIVNVPGFDIVDGEAALSGEINPGVVTGHRLIADVNKIPGFPQQLITESIAPGCSRHCCRPMLIPLPELNQQKAELFGVGFNPNRFQGFQQLTIQLDGITSFVNTFLKRCDPLLMLRNC